MPDGHTLALFVAAALVLLVFPGPAVLFVVTRSVEHGPRVGLASVAGIATGGIVHVLGAAAGVSALLVRSAAAFSAVKFVGAAYLVWLGLRRLFAPQAATPGADVAEADRARTAGLHPSRAFRQGVVVNVLNPKVALFFLAFLPQFVDRDAGSVLVQTLLLGFLFLALGLITDGTYAVVAGTIGGRIRRRLPQANRAARAGGLVYIGLGLTAALTPHRRSAA